MLHFQPLQLYIVFLENVLAGHSQYLLLSINGNFGRMGKKKKKALLVMYLASFTSFQQQRSASWFSGG